MILVDTSVWIEILNGRQGQKLTGDDLLRFLTCGPVAQEVLQGVRTGGLGESFRDAFLAIPRLSDPLPWNIFLEAAEIYREGRKRGYTIRSSTDCLIAAIGIANRVPVWHRDRDFTNIAKYSRLEVIEKY